MPVASSRSEYSTTTVVPSRRAISPTRSSGRSLADRQIRHLGARGEVVPEKHGVGDAGQRIVDLEGEDRRELRRREPVERTGAPQGQNRPPCPSGESARRSGGLQQDLPACGCRPPAACPGRRSAPTSGRARTSRPSANAARVVGVVGGRRQDAQRQRRAVARPQGRRPSRRDGRTASCPRTGPNGKSPSVRRSPDASLGRRRAARARSRPARSGRLTRTRSPPSRARPSASARSGMASGGVNAPAAPVGSSWPDELLAPAGRSARDRVPRAAQ